MDQDHHRKGNHDPSLKVDQTISRDMVDQASDSKKHDNGDTGPEVQIVAEKFKKLNLGKCPNFETFCEGCPVCYTRAELYKPASYWPASECLGGSEFGI